TIAPSGTSSLRVERLRSTAISTSPSGISGSSRSSTMLELDARTSNRRAVVHGPVRRMESLWARMFSMVMGSPFVRFRIVSRILVRVKLDPIRPLCFALDARPDPRIPARPGGAQPARGGPAAPVRPPAPDPAVGQGHGRQRGPAGQPVQDDRAPPEGGPDRGAAHGARPALPRADGLRAHRRRPPPGARMARG